MKHSVDLLGLDRVEIAVWFSKQSKRWLAHCRLANQTGHGPRRDMAIEALRVELDVEERALIDGYEPLPPGEPEPDHAERLTIARRTGRKWA